MTGRTGLSPGAALGVDLLSAFDAEDISDVIARALVSVARGWGAKIRPGDCIAASAHLVATLEHAGWPISDLSNRSVMLVPADQMDAIAEALGRLSACPDGN